jgi:hypothetical protein
MLNAKRFRREENKNRFKVYIRECKRCGEYAEVPTKLTKYCALCKIEVEKERVKNNLEARRKNRENELNSNNGNVVELTATN